MNVMFTGYLKMNISQKEKEGEAKLDGKKSVKYLVAVTLCACVGHELICEKNFFQGQHVYLDGLVFTIAFNEAYLPIFYNYF